MRQQAVAVRKQVLEMSGIPVRAIRGTTRHDRIDEPRVNFCLDWIRSCSVDNGGADLQPHCQVLAEPRENAIRELFRCTFGT